LKQIDYAKEQIPLVGWVVVRWKEGKNVRKYFFRNKEEMKTEIEKCQEIYGVIAKYDISVMFMTNKKKTHLDLIIDRLYNKRFNDSQKSNIKKGGIKYVPMPIYEPKEKVIKKLLSPNPPEKFIRVKGVYSNKQHIPDE